MSINLEIDNANKKTDDLFLPNFCDVYSVFLSILIMELLAFVLVLVPFSKIGYNWNYVATNFISDLAMISLFIQWNTLISIGLLCVMRRWLKYLKNNVIIGIISYLVILLVTWLVSEFAWQLHEYISFDNLTHHYSTYQVFLLRNLAISAIISAIALRYFYVQHQWKHEVKTNAYARVQALQARIRPHFLFNSMNTIASLIRFQPQKAEQVVEDFADLFRASLLDTKLRVTFTEELTLCQQYLGIEILRLGNRLQVVWEVDTIPKDAILPPLCLQPLLENAVYHGIQPLAKGGKINITGLFDDKYITINVENPLAASKSNHQGNRIAQQNIRQRLNFFYGSTAKLNVYEDTGVYHADLSFPYQNKSFLELK